MYVVSLFSMLSYCLVGLYYLSYVCWLFCMVYFYFLCSLLLYCVFCFIVFFLLYVVFVFFLLYVVFVFFVLVSWTLPPGENPIAVNNNNNKLIILFLVYLTTVPETQDCIVSKYFPWFTPYIHSLLPYNQCIVSVCLCSRFTAPYWMQSLFTKSVLRPFDRTIDTVTGNRYVLQSHTSLMGKHIRTWTLLDC
jgi:hypothetical protein